MAQLALNLAIGFAANALISLINPTQKQEGPRLSDLSAPKSNYGVQIPKVWGSVRVAGNLIWAKPIREKKTKKKQGGKGGGAQTAEYSYFGDFAVLLCTGPIVGVKRVWLNSKLVYNVAHDSDEETFTNSINLKDKHLHIHLGTADQLPDSVIEAYEGSDRAPAYRHRAYLLFNDLLLADYGNRLPTVTAEVCTTGSIDSSGRITANKAELATIIKDICYSAGLTVSEIDTSEINQSVTGFFINNSIAAREALSQLQQAYFFDCIESNGKLKFINQLRPGVTQQLMLSQLASYEYGQARPANFSETRTQDLELPNEVAITYLDPSLNYSEGIQYSRKSVAFNSNAQSISLPIALTPSEALTIVDKLLYLAWIRRRNYKFSLLFRHGLLEPGDLVSALFHGAERTIVQISKVNIGANLLLEIEALGYEASIYGHQAAVEAEYCEKINNSEGNNTYQLSRRNLLSLAKVSIGNTIYTPGDDYTYDLNQGTVTRIDSASIPDGANLTICYRLDEISAPPASSSVVAQGDTTLRVLDISLVSDSDVDNGLYLAGDGEENWQSATVYVSRNGGNSYELATNLTANSVFGTCNTVLAPGPTTGMDATNTLSVTIREGVELESISLVDLNNRQNTALIGNEIIRFQTAVLAASNTYQLSNLLRGRRGTEWAVSTHTAGENFYLLSDYLERVEGNVADIGRTLQFKAITPGQTLDEVSPVAITVEGNSLKPYAPINLGATKDPSGSITITWIRRDRKAGDRTDYANFPLSEAFERYDVDIYNGAAVVRTVNSTEATVSYTAAEQIVDFGSAQTTISIRVYQISGIVGRGYPASAILTLNTVYPPPTITSLNPTQGAVGVTVAIAGNHFTGATAVAFNGTAATFTINSDSQITATVPNGATSGAITVATPGGTASST